RPPAAPAPRAPPAPGSPPARPPWGGVLGERRGRRVGGGFRREGVVVVVRAREARGELAPPEPRRDRERAHVVGEAGGARGDEVRERPVRALVSVRGLLAQELEAQPLVRTFVFIVENDSVALGRRRPEAVDAARAEGPLRDDPVEERVRVLPEVAIRG